MHKYLRGGLLFSLVALSVSVGQAQSKRGDVVLKLNFDETDAPQKFPATNPQVHLETGYQGTKSLRIESPVNGGKNVAITVPLSLESVRGARVKVEAMVKSTDVVKPPQAYNGIKVMMHMVTPTGQNYPQQNDLYGTFDWKKIQYVANVPANVTSGELILGIEATTGVTWIDDISVTVTMAPRTRPVHPPTGPVDNRRTLPRLRGAMVSNRVSNDDLNTLGREWHANLIRYQLVRWDYPRNETDAADMVAYDKWLDEALQRLDAVLLDCARNGLMVVVDLHTPPGGRDKSDNGDRLFKNKIYQDELVQLWDRISQRYRGNKTVWGYDIANEPNALVIPDELMNWHDLATKVAQTIRKNDAEHAIIVEPEMGGDPAALNFLEPIPVPGVVYSPHFYTPFEFTHQGVYDRLPRGVTYPGQIAGKPWDKEKLREALKPVIDFQHDYNVPIYIGEFGAVRWAPNGAQWVRDCISIFEENNWDWSYHAFREWQGWNIELGPDFENQSPTATPTDRQQALRTWFNMNKQPPLVETAAPAAARAITVAPAEIKQVRGEKLKLSAEKPQSYFAGTHLRETQTMAPGSGVPAKGSLVASSVVVRSGDQVLEEGRDYLLEHDWAALGIGPNSRVTTNDTVSVDYDYSLRRLDSLVRTADGKEIVKPGQSALTMALPPELAAGETRLANIYVPYHSDGKNAEIYPLEETAAQAKTQTTPSRIPHTLAKLQAGQPVRIVCWGDSVTEGGDASSPETRYPAVFEQRLKARYPNAKIDLQVVAIGGSNSKQWLDPAKNPFASPEKQALGRFERITEFKPDLVTVEFVNDAYMNAEQVEAAYGEILRRIHAMGAEAIFITPHFTMPEMMHFQTLRDAESRSYVLALIDFANKNGVAIADASSRWGHLWREGVPYVTLLRNGINHPEDKGHALFADELMKCFGP